VPTRPTQAYLVSHTHWDREWYLPYHRFRVNLVEVVGRVLDALDQDPAFVHFVLDGQSAVLEDYLEAIPGDRPRITRMIASGALAVGPWYILPDEFLVSGEATVRNLVYGRKQAAPLGPVQRVGYMPDSFGHLAQIPQILRSAGIDSFIFTRGLGDEAENLGWLFNWCAPDGSSVLAVNQCDGYCNCGGLGFAEIWHAHTRRTVDSELAVEKVKTLLEKMSERPGADPALLNNGCDHFPPQQNFGKILEALREAHPETTFTHTGFAGFLAAAREHTPDAERPTWTGELLGGRDHLILSGVWSARIGLKQENERCQNILTRYTEPLAAAATFLHDDPWPQGLLDEAWRQLLLNHPHDSICGCSTDEVHREMDTRFAGVRQSGEQLVARLMDRLTPTFARREDDDRETVICVANPLPWSRSEVVERIVVLQPLGYDLEQLRLVDETGREVPLRILERRFLERFWGIDYRAELFCSDQQKLLGTYLERFGERILGTEQDRDTKDCFLTVQFLARNLPAVGHAQFILTDRPAALPAVPVENTVTCRTTGEALEMDNGLLKVTLHPDGTFDLVDLRNGRTWPGLNRFEDTEDIGDEYDYSPAGDSRSVHSSGCTGTLEILEDSGLIGRIEAGFTLDLPPRVTADRNRRATGEVRCATRVRLSLRAGCGRIDVETRFDNRAEDHRLRVEFPTGIQARDVYSDGQFMINSRPVIRPTGDQWAQPAPLTWPQQDFSWIADEQGGLAVLNRGLPEFETRYDTDRTVIYSLTLLRAVGWLSRDDFPTRRNTNAGPTLYTPEAQCPGTHTFDYALVPFSGDPLSADLRGESDNYRVPPVTHQGVADQLRPGGGSLLAKTEPRVAVTAIKRAEDHHALIVRLYNQTASEQIENLHLGLPVVDAEKVGVLEEPLEVLRDSVAVTAGGSRIRVPLAPFEIATIAIAFDLKENP